MTSQFELHIASMLGKSLMHDHFGIQFSLTFCQPPTVDRRKSSHQNECGDAAHQVMIQIVAADERPPALQESLSLQSRKPSNDFQFVWGHSSCKGVGKSVGLLNSPSKTTT